MKQQKRVLGFLALILTFVGGNILPTQAQTVEPSITICPLSEDTRPPNVKFSPDGQYLAAIWPEGNQRINPNFVTPIAGTKTVYRPKQWIRIWNVSTGALITTVMDEDFTYLEKFDVSPDYIVAIGHYAHSKEMRSKIMLWDIHTGQQIKTLKSPEAKGGATTLAFSPDGQFILATYSRLHSIWNVTSGEKTLIADEGFFTFSQFSPDGSFILTSRENGEVNIWDWKSGKLLHTFDAGTGGPNPHGAFSPDGKYILAQVNNRMILADAHTYQKVHDARPVASFSPDGKYMLDMCVGSKVAVIVWDVEKEKLAQEFPVSGFIFASFVTSTSVMIIKSSVEKPVPQTVLSVLDVETGKELEQLTVDLGANDVYFHAVSPDGKYLAIRAVHTVKVELWDIKTGTEILLES